MPPLRFGVYCEMQSAPDKDHADGVRARGVGSEALQTEVVEVASFAEVV